MLKKVILGASLAMLTATPVLAGGMGGIMGGHHFSGFAGGAMGVHSPGFITHMPNVAVHAPTASAGRGAWGGRSAMGVAGGVAHSPGFMMVHTPSPGSGAAISPGRVNWAGKFHTNGAGTTLPRGSFQPSLHSRLATIGNKGDTNSPPPAGNKGDTNSPPPRVGGCGDTNSPPCTIPPSSTTTNNTANSGSSSDSSATNNNTNNIGVGATANANTGASTSAATNGSVTGSQSLINNVQIPSQGNNSGDTTVTAIVPVITLTSTTTENVEKTVVRKDRRRRQAYAAPRPRVSCCLIQHRDACISEEVCRLR